MLLTVQGTYENGTIRLDESVPPNLTVTGRVLITFLSETPSATSSPSPEVSAAAFDKAARLLKAIGLKQPRFSFDEALALTVKARGSISDAVEQERGESNW